MNDLVNVQMTMVIDKNQTQNLKRLEDAIKKMIDTQSYYKDVSFVSWKKMK